MMSGMNLKFTPKFLESLTAFLHTVCDGDDLEFQSLVQFSGHIFMTIDNGKTIQYIVDEKIFKAENNQLTSVGQSFNTLSYGIPQEVNSNLSVDTEEHSFSNDLSNHGEEIAAAHDSELAKSDNTYNVNVSNMNLIIKYETAGSTGYETLAGPSGACSNREPSHPHVSDIYNDLT